MVNPNGFAAGHFGHSQEKLGCQEKGSFRRIVREVAAADHAAELCRASPSLYEDLLSSCSAPGTMLGSGATAIAKTGVFQCPEWDWVGSQAAG